MASRQLAVLRAILSSQPERTPPLDLPTIRADLERFVGRLPGPDPPARRVGLASCEAEWLGSGDPSVSGCCLFLHGGGYCSGSLASHRKLAARLALASRLPVLSVGYRLAPEHPFPAALEDAWSAWEHLRGLVPANRVVVAGDSAGGGLAVALSARLREEGREGPVALALLSPWVDLTDRPREEAPRDPVLSRSGLVEMSALYRGEVDARHPLVSPLYGELEGLPPTLVQVGGAELLRSDGRALAAALAKARIRVELDEWPEMLHGWHLFAGLLPEGDRAIEEAAAFLARELGRL